MGWDNIAGSVDHIINENTREIDGKLYTWQTSNQLQEMMDYLGLSKEEAGHRMGLTDEQIENYDKPGDSATGSWVPASYTNPNGTLFGPSWMLPAMLAGPAIATGIGALVGGAAGAGAGGAGATLPISSAATLPGALAPGTAVGLGSAPAIGAGIGAGAAGAGAALPMGSASTLPGALAPGTTASLGSAPAAGVGAASTGAKVAGSLKDMAIKEGIGLGTGALQSYFASKAADKGVAQQQAATDQALAANERALGGYMNRGNVAGDTLQGLMGLGPLPGQPGFGGGMSPQATAQASQAQMPMAPTGSRPRGVLPDEGQAVPRVQVEGTAGMAQAQTQSSYVPMRAPNGRMVNVPPDRVSEALQNGGVRL